MPREIAPGRSCLECRRRKIKCDRSHPCSYCVKVRIQCKYPAKPLVHNEDALGRVASLESKVQAMEKRLLEVEEPRQSPLICLTPAAARETPREAPAPASTAAELLRPQATIDLEALRPIQSRIAAHWQRYLDVVDPLLKLFHTPTVQKLVMTAIHNRTKLDFAPQCLLFAIYYAAVASMSRQECQIELEEERDVLLEQYRTGLNYYLSYLDLLKSTDIVVLQAFTLYLITARCDEQGPDVYALVGLASGMALKMGLNKDGAALGLPPFEIEMRRRLWWQLLILDIRVAEDRQSEPCILESSFNTRLPSNIPDGHLHPQMSRLPDCGPGRTEILFSLVRFEGSYFARQMVFSDGFSKENAYIYLSAPQKREAIDLFKERIEKQYLSHCDDNIPFDKVTVMSIRLILAKLKLMVDDPTPMEDPVSQDRLATRQGWIDLLCKAEKLRQYEGGRQWLWLFQTYIEWDALTQLLQELSTEPIVGDVGGAWKAVSAIYDYWNNTATTRHDYRWTTIEKLRQEVQTALQ
ncbi:fungal-specific transcription factor domain-containing protein [Aspergillus crustosus]